MTEENWLRRLSKSRTDKWIGGVCGGLGKYTPLPSWIWRVIFCLMFFCFGTGLLIYVLLWIFMPQEPLSERTSCPQPPYKEPPGPYDSSSPQE